MASVPDELAGSSSRQEGKISPTRAYITFATTVNIVQSDSSALN